MQKVYTFGVEYLFQLENKLEKLIDEGYHVDSVQIIRLDAHWENDYEALVIVSKEES